jgi:hypothetical protein
VYDFVLSATHSFETERAVSSATWSPSADQREAAGGDSAQESPGKVAPRASAPTGAHRAQGSADLVVHRVDMDRRFPREVSEARFGELLEKIGRRAERLLGAPAPTSGGDAVRADSVRSRRVGASFDVRFR